MNDNTSSGGIGFLSLLTILFIGLKLTSYIDWSWGWILSPILIPASVISLLIVLLVIFKKIQNIKE